MIILQTKCKLLQISAAKDIDNVRGKKPKYNCGRSVAVARQKERVTLIYRPIRVTLDGVRDPIRPTG